MLMIFMICQDIVEGKIMSCPDDHEDQCSFLSAITFVPHEI